MPSFFRALDSIEARGEDSGSSPLSTGGIVGVAIAGALVLFVALSLSLIYFARWQERRRQLAEQAELETGLPSQGDTESFPQRLRRKYNADLEVSPEPEERNRISLPVLPPVFSRRQSLNLAPFRDEFSSSAEQSLREKQRGRELRELRRKSSWIDEDALHGPRTLKPKHKQSRLSLRSKLSFKQSLNSPVLLSSPTLPHPLNKTNPSPIESGGEDQPVKGDGCLSSSTILPGPRPAPQDVSAYQASPLGSQQPLATTQTTRTTSTIAFEAAQKLAGTSRLPDLQRPPRACASAIDLSEILQLTAARLQDGNKSPRRQTMFAESTAKSGHQLVRFEDVHFDDSEPVSPARSQKSAPSVMVFAELEAAEASPRKEPTPITIQKRSHDRHVSQMSHASQFSMASEPDSLIASHRGSQHDVHTALSSPSRHEREKELTLLEQVHELRPSTSGSESSALSTLYSVDEELEASQARNPRIQYAMENATHQPYERYDKSPMLPSENGGSLRMGRLRRGTLGQFHGPRPMPCPEPLAVSVSPRDRPAKPRETSLHFSIYVADDDPFVAEPSPSQDSPRLSQVFKVLPSNMNRPETGPKALDPTRTMNSKPKARVTKATETPTSPTKNLRIVLPPPLVLRPSSPTQGTHERRSSGTLSSRSIGSSAHESFSNGDRVSIATARAQSTATLLTIPSPERSPTRHDERPVSRTGFHYDDPLPSSDDELEEDEERDLPRSHPLDGARLPSDGSVYSQEGSEKEDRLLPLRVGNRESTQIGSLVAELRRMNSQVSQTSGYSTTSTASSTTLATTVIPEEVSSPTLSALRGGGFSPGRRGSRASGASRNYLAVGSPGKKSQHDEWGHRGFGGDSNKEILGGASLASRHQRSGSGIPIRSRRRGAIGSAGVGSGPELLAGRLQELDRRMASVSRGVRAEASSESLYDEHGFLKGSPMGMTT